MTIKSKIKSTLIASTKNQSERAGYELSTLLGFDEHMPPACAWNWPSTDAVDAKLRTAVAYTKQYLYCDGEHLIGCLGTDGPRDVAPLYNRVRAAMHASSAKHGLRTDETRATMVDAFSVFASLWSENWLSEIGWPELARSTSKRLNAVGLDFEVPSDKLRVHENPKTTDAVLHFCNTLSDKFAGMYEDGASAHLSLVAAGEDTLKQENGDAIEGSH
jgi:hypothetical protein